MELVLVAIAIACLVGIGSPLLMAAWESLIRW